jgi:hypothetical protein
MKAEAAALKARTKRFALDVLDFIDTIPNEDTNRRIGRQLSDAATSVGASYRADDPETPSARGRRAHGNLRRVIEHHPSQTRSNQWTEFQIISNIPNEFAEI